MASAAGVIWVASTRPSAGKTRVAIGLIHALRRAGLHPVAVKPIELAAGYGEDHDLTSPDADLLGAAAMVAVPPLVRAPYRLAAKQAPLLATRHAGIELGLDDLAATVTVASNYGAPVIVDSPSDALSPLYDGGCGLDVARHLGALLVLVCPAGDDAEPVLAAARARGVRIYGTVAPDDPSSPEDPAWDAIGRAVLDALAG